MPNGAGYFLRTRIKMLQSLNVWFSFPAFGRKMAKKNKQKKDLSPNFRGNMSNRDHKTLRMIVKKQKSGEGNVFGFYRLFCGHVGGENNMNTDFHRVLRLA
ncbi:Hypothetical predicted protein [Xyrichtys novacula]|uniref:Uncharacterized protein n=1 Tax=Xyrichtys novacula TaxID=13765 RepID=A0AAV1ETI4_XYRNO|nr:Hypothetical predicted protein [Xyrichtys novacula]